MLTLLSSSIRLRRRRKVFLLLAITVKKLRRPLGRVCKCNMQCADGQQLWFCDPQFFFFLLFSQKLRGWVTRNIEKKSTWPKEARKVWDEEYDVHDTGNEFQSAMHNGKKAGSLLLVLHTASRFVFFRSVCVARSETRGARLDCRLREGGVTAGLTASRKAAVCIVGMSTPMLAIWFPLEHTWIVAAPKVEKLHISRGFYTRLYGISEKQAMA